MANTVGVRDFKQDAPRLLRRAARGERFVVTRYGRPLAWLVPFDALERPAEPDASTRAWESERRAFESLGPALVRRFRGKYVAVHGGRVVDSATDQEVLYQRVWRKLDGAVFFIGRVGAEPAIVDMPDVEIG